MNRRVRSVCTIAGNRVDGGVGQPTMLDAVHTAEAMQQPALAVDKTTLLSAAQKILDPKLTATEAVKEVASRLQVFWQVTAWDSGSHETMPSTSYRTD